MTSDSGRYARECRLVNGTPRCYESRKINGIRQRFFVYVYSSNGWIPYFRGAFHGVKIPFVRVRSGVVLLAGLRHPTSLRNCFALRKTCGIALCSHPGIWRIAREQRCCIARAGTNTTWRVYFVATRRPASNGLTRIYLACAFTGDAGFESQFAL